MFEGLKKRLSNFMDSVVSKEKAEIKKEEQDEGKTLRESAASIHEGHDVGQQGIGHNAVHKENAPGNKDTAINADTAIREKEPEHKEANFKPHAVEKEAVHKADAGAKPTSHKTDVHKTINNPDNEGHAPKTAVAKPDMAKAHNERKPTVGAGTKLKSIIFSNVRLKESDIDPFIESLKIGLLESDVNYDVAEKLADSIKSDLLSRGINAKGIDSEIRQMIRESIRRVLAKRSGTDLIQKAREKAEAHDLPFKILFIGPNGAGKTTTMAKIANMFITNGLTCVMSASDTFRAAAIEQTTFHADKLGIRVVKGAYGSDPASIAFDAIAHAKAHNVDVVLMDSAGRQETNKSLIEELKKISRVTKPDMKIFIGEAIAGNSILGQVKALNEAVSIDGIILTKLDCDAKGGNTISILSELDIPILFFGIGEKYNDIMPYDPDFIVDNILPNN